MSLKKLSLASGMEEKEFHFPTRAQCALSTRPTTLLTWMAEISKVFVRLKPSKHVLNEGMRSAPLSAHVLIFATSSLEGYAEHVIL